MTSGRTAAAGDAPRRQDRQEGGVQEGGIQEAGIQEAGTEADRRLDEAIKESFPASDPPAITPPRRTAVTPPVTQEAPKARPVDEAGRAHQSEELDEALEESFPASDPPASVQP